MPQRARATPDAKSAHKREMRTQTQNAKSAHRTQTQKAQTTANAKGAPRAECAQRAAANCGRGRPGERSVFRGVECAACCAACSGRFCVGAPGGGLGRRRENRLGGPPCCGGGHRDPHLVYNDGGVGAWKRPGHEREAHQLHHSSHPCELHYTHCRCVVYCTIPIPLTKFHRSERSRCI